MGNILGGGVVLALVFFSRDALLGPTAGPWDRISFGLLMTGAMGGWSDVFRKLLSLFRPARGESI